jgi:hypothetical protein
MSIVRNVSEESDVVQTRRLNLGNANNRNTWDLQLSFTFVTDSLFASRQIPQPQVILRSPSVELISSDHVSRTILNMPRYYRSHENAEVYSVLRRLENATDQQCRTILYHLIHDSQEARDACNEAFEEGPFNYFDTEIHYLIVEGLATRFNVLDYINNSGNLDLDTQVGMLVEVGTDLVVHHLRWSTEDLDIIHGRIQEYLMYLLEDNIALVSSTWETMDQLVADEGRYSVLAAKLKEDKREEEEARGRTERGRRL